MIIPVVRFLRAIILSIGLPSWKKYYSSNEEMSSGKEVSVIIPVRNSYEITKRCLNSLVRFGTTTQVIIVDDSSDCPQTKSLLIEYCHKHNWKLIQQEKAMGHSIACETGAKIAKSKYLCFLNSDTFVTPWTWLPAVMAFNKYPEIGVTGPSTSYAATKQCLRRAMYCRHYWTDNQICAYAEQYVKHYRASQPIEMYNGVSGFCFFIRTDLWYKLNGFDPALPDYGNESELFQRVQKNGKRVVWLRNSYVHHFGNASYGKIFTYGQLSMRRKAAKEYIIQKNMKY